MPTPPSGFTFGRMTGTSDRGQRTLTTYDERGRPIWTARQMALLPAIGAMGGTTITNPLPPIDRSDDPTGSSPREFDEDHSYVMTNTYDRADRPYEKTWPLDPDYAGTGSAPVIAGRIFYNSRSLPRVTHLVVDGDADPIHRAIIYNEYREVVRIVNVRAAPC